MKRLFIWRRSVAACRECNRDISAQAMSCPHCGCLVYSVSPLDPGEVAPYQPVRLWRAVGITVAVVVVLVVMMARMAASRETRRAHRAHLAVQKADRQRLQDEAGDDGRQLTARQYGDTWPFTVTAGELECRDKAVLMHTPLGTYTLNGTAMDRYGNTYKSFREIAKPVLGLENELQAKMLPPREMIQRGLRLCD